MIFMRDVYRCSDFGLYFPVIWLFYFSIYTLYIHTHNLHIEERGTRNQAGLGSGFFFNLFFFAREEACNQRILLFFFHVLDRSFIYEALRTPKDRRSIRDQLVGG